MEFITPTLVILGFGLLFKKITNFKGDIVSIQDSLNQLREAVASLPSRVDTRVATLQTSLDNLRGIADEYANYRVAEDAEDVDQEAQLADVRARLEQQIVEANQASEELLAEVRKINAIAEVPADEAAPVDPGAPADAPVAEPETAEVPAADGGPGIIPEAGPVADAPVDSEIAEEPAATEES